MSDLLHSLFPPLRKEAFEFSGLPRKIEPVAALPFQWPTKICVANEYVDGWIDEASSALAKLSLSNRTLREVASHVSRRDGTIRLTDRALSARSGRSLASTKRDLQRLKLLGFLTVDYEAGDRRQERIRVLTLAVPFQGRSSQRVPR